MPFCFCVSIGSCKFVQLSIFAKVRKSHGEWMSHCLTTHLQRIYVLSRRPYPLRPYNCPSIQTSLTRASAQFVMFHIGLQYCTQTEYSCTPCPKKYAPWLLSVSCCNLSTILLIINPLNTVRLSLRSHQRSSVLSSLSDSAAESESWLFLPVIVAFTSTTVPFALSFSVLV